MVVGRRQIITLWIFCHLIVEKALKATIAKNTAEIPPKIHDLRRLAKLGEILSKDHVILINNVSSLHIDARYTEFKEKVMQTLSKEYCAKLVEETESFLCWIKQR